ncbi:MAG TPA: hypothetical protein VF320_12220 [Acidimicrobiales bacterium]
MRNHPFIVAVAAAVVVVGLVTHRAVLPVLVAGVVCYLLLRIGTVMLGGLARPVPEPLPPGELRKVKLLFRCSICGTEVRMTAANNEDPEPPRHCQEDMDLVAPTME